MKNGHKIVDSHCHIYPDKIAERASNSTSNFYHVAVRNDGKLSTMREIAERAGVDHTIVQSVATDPAQVKNINEYIYSETYTNPLITGLGTLHPASKYITSDIDHLIELGLKGVKMHADIQSVAINDKRCYPIYERLEGTLPILMHAGDKRYQYSNPDQLGQVLRDFPKLTVIGAHFAGWSVWDEAADKLSGFENLYIDTSSTIGFIGVEHTKKLIRRYDINKIMFGSDFPMWSAENELECIEMLGLTDEELDKVLGGNAIGLFDLKV